MNYDLFPELPTPKNNNSLRLDRVSPRNFWTHPKFPYKTTEGIYEYEQHIRRMGCDPRFIYKTIEDKNQSVSACLPSSPSSNDYLYWVKDQLKYLPSIESLYMHFGTELLISRRVTISSLTHVPMNSERAP